MTPLRQRVITAMQMHGYSPRTHQSYLAAVRGLAKYTHRSPARMGSGLAFCLLPFAFCLLPFAFCLSASVNRTGQLR